MYIFEKNCARLSPDFVIDVCLQFYYSVHQIYFCVYFSILESKIRLVFLLFFSCFVVFCLDLSFLLMDFWVMWNIDEWSFFLFIGALEKFLLGNVICKNFDWFRVQFSFRGNYWTVFFCRNSFNYIVIIVHNALGNFTEHSRQGVFIHFQHVELRALIISWIVYI